MSASFVLRGVNPKEISIMMYADGGIAHSKQPPDKIVKSNVFGISVQLLPSKEHVKSFKDRSGNLRNTLVNAISDAAPCYWCRTPRSKFRSDPFLRPISMSKKGSMYVIIGMGNYCSIECCYAYVIECSSNRTDMRDPMFERSELILRSMYKMAGHNDEIRPAKDWRLLDINGGRLTEEQYRSNNLNVVMNGNFSVARANLEYDLWSPP